MALTISRVVTLIASSTSLSLALSAFNGHFGIETIGVSRPYTLTIMLPNKDFAELIRSGAPVELDAEDLAVLLGKALPVLG